MTRTARCPSSRLAAHRTASFVACVVLGACHRRIDEPRASSTALLGQTTAVAPPSSRPLAPVPPLGSGAKDPVPLGTDRLRFAVIGDYGLAGEDERRVADLVKGYAPDLVITTGDNNYPYGAAGTIDRNIGQFYASFIGSYHGQYGPGASENRFFPSLGNHDWYTDGAQPYLDYFTLPGNERYYSFVRGPVEFFAVDSDPHEPDGTTSTSRQAKWLAERARASSAAWQIAYMHHPPFSSSVHGSTVETEWPYGEWGLDVVLAGHDHTYERARIGGVTYLVNGLGGAHEYEFKAAIDGSALRYNEKHGAQLAEATPHELRLTFVNVDGARIDEVVLTR